MADMDKAEAISLLKAAADQTRAIIELIDQQDRCMDAIRRIHAVRDELHDISLALLDRHLISCVAAAQDRDGCQKVLDDIQVMFWCANRFGLD
jgi:DNA-binding FrmR family transcriptional regulator